MPGDSSPPVAPESLGRKHETSDQNPRNVIIIAASAAVMLAASLAAAVGVFHGFAARRPMQQMQPLGLILAPNLQPLARPPGPNLDVDDDHAQMTKLRREQAAKLNGYGWVDRRRGVVHIPISLAMDRLLQRGLPVRTNGVIQVDDSPEQLIQKIPQQK